MALVDKGMGKAQAETLGLPEGFQAYSPFPFKGIDQQADRTAMANDDFFVLENFIKIGDGYLRTLWDHGSSLYSAPSGLTIVKFYWFNIGTKQYVAVFLSDGTGVSVSYPAGVVTTMTANANTFYNYSSYPGVTPACAQWGTQYLVISSNISVNSYWVWDGSALHYAGTVSPNVTLTGSGAGYTSTPTVTAYGGQGSGIVATATIANSAVTSVQITNPGSGYLPGDVVQFQFSGGGTDNGAQLLAHLTTGVVDYVTMLDGGSGYTAPPSVSLTGGSGSGAAGYTTVVATGLAGVTINSGGSGYASAPSVLITGGGGSGAAATATVSGGAVNTITINSAGSGYTTLPAITFSGGGGTNASGTAVFIATSVASVVLSSGGSGYTSAPAIAFTGSSSSTAIAASHLTSAKVSSISVVSGGSGYTVAPTLTISGGGGSGATAVASISGGAISSVSVGGASGGSGYTSVPAVIISAGANQAASATATLMPFGANGLSCETFQSRVWLANTHSVGAQQNGGIILASASGSLSDFSTANGAVIFTSNEPFLRSQFVNLKQSQGYLYTFGDSACDVIQNVTTNAVTGATTFQFNNVDPQIGAAWRDTAAYFGLSVYFANAEGVYGLYGGAVKDTSNKVTRLFDNMVLPADGGVVPSAAVAHIHTKKVYLINMTIQDPNTGASRPVMLMFDEAEWGIASQSSALTYIGTQSANSSATAWGTDGSSLFPLFNTPSMNLTKTFSTKLYGAESFPVVKQGWGLWMLTEDKSVGKQGVWLTATMDTESGSIPTAVSPLSFGGYPMLATEPGNNWSVFMGITAKSNSLDFVLRHLVIGYAPAWGGYGDPPIASGL